MARATPRWRGAGGSVPGPVPAGRCSQARGEAGSALVHASWGSFLVEPCSSNWKGAGNPSVWRALEPLFERSVIFQSNSLPKPPFIKYSWDPFSPGTPSPRLSPKNQSGSSACSNASCVFREPWGCRLRLPPPPISPPTSPASRPPVSSQGGSGGWGSRGGTSGTERWGDVAGCGQGRSGPRVTGTRAGGWDPAPGSLLTRAADFFAFTIDACRPPLLPGLPRPPPLRARRQPGRSIAAPLLMAA